MNVAILLVGSMVVMFVVVATVIGQVRKRERERTDEFHRLAEELGLEFFPEGDPTVQSSLGRLHLFNVGHSKVVKNMIAGTTDDIKLAVFGYRYVIGGGQNQQVHQQSVVSFQSPLLSLPEFEMRPENFMHRIGEKLGYQDIDFDSHPEFSRRYLLRGPVESEIRDRFNPEVLAFFESITGISVEASGDLLVYYRAGKRIQPEQLRGFMEEAFQVYALLKHPDDS